MRNLHSEKSLTPSMPITSSTRQQLFYDTSTTVIAIKLLEYYNIIKFDFNDFLFIFKIDKFTCIY